MIAWLTSLLRTVGSWLRFGRSAENDEFDAELRDVFFAEMDDVTELMQRAFASWRVNSADADALKSLRRGFHTIKGSALLVGASPLGEFCRHLEQLTIRLMEQQVKITPAIVVTVEQAIALLPAFARSIREGRAPPAQAQALAKRTLRLLD